MKIPEEKQYEYLTAHLQYLNEKIIQSFILFIKLSTLIIGSAFYLHLQLPIGDQKRMSLANGVDLLLIAVSVGIILLILNNLRSWREYRTVLSKQYPGSLQPTGAGWWISEVVMCILIVLVCAEFYYFNPLN